MNATNKISPAGVLLKDQRGRHGNHHRLPQEDLLTAKEHIASIPKVNSHYTRNVNPDKEYLSEDIPSYSELHRCYKKWLREVHPTKTPLSMRAYCKRVKKEFPKLKLKKCRKDTCKI